MYSVFTGLSALSQGWIDFAIYRFITGLGVGGVFGLAVALIADALPDKARPHALGTLQALSAVGNITAGLIRENGRGSNGGEWLIGHDRNRHYTYFLTEPRDFTSFAVT